VGRNRIELPRETEGIDSLKGVGNMKKFLSLFIVLILLFTVACQIAIGLESDKLANGVQTGEQAGLDDVEENINQIDIQDDLNLTEKAEEREKTEKDILVDQEQIEQDQVENGDRETITVFDGDEALEIPVVKTFATQLPPGIEKQLAYDKYPISYDYLLVVGSNINIRRAPRVSSPVIAKAALFEKLNVIQEVRGEYLERYASDVWYRVFWKEDGEMKYGFIFGYFVDPRRFQFEKMAEAVQKLKEEVESTQTAYIANYKNRNGLPPLYKGKTIDPYGNVRGQSAAGYYDLNNLKEFRYFPDGMLLTILGEEGNYYKVRTLSFPGEYWVEKKYVSFRNSLEELTKVVVVDRNYQNEGVFEYLDGKWKLISYTFATTGIKGKYTFETPLGYFMAIETRDRFLYLDDVTGEIAGYAPYAIRFSAGGYIHGVPVDFKFREDGSRIDPGMKEYLYTIGTTPRSHKCVRNFTSHAKFLYDWIEIGKSAVIVIE